MEELTPVDISRLDEPVKDPVAEYISKLIYSVAVGHIYHLNAKTYEHHITLDEFYKGLPELVDVLAETYLAMGGVIPTVVDMSWVDSPREMIVGLITEGQLIHPTLPPYLTNPLEDILTFCNQILYKWNLV